MKIDSLIIKLHKIIIGLSFFGHPVDKFTFHSANDSRLLFPLPVNLFLLSSSPDLFEWGSLQVLSPERRRNQSKFSTWNHAMSSCFSSSFSQIIVVILCILIMYKFNWITKKLRKKSIYVFNLCLLFTIVTLSLNLVTYVMIGGLLLNKFRDGSNYSAVS
jgi:magnesium-transporting ATPase (P-type)